MACNRGRPDFRVIVLEGGPSGQLDPRPIADPNSGLSDAVVRLPKLADRGRPSKPSNRPVAPFDNRRDPPYNRPSCPRALRIRIPIARGEDEAWSGQQRHCSWRCFWRSPARCRPKHSISRTWRRADPPPFAFAIGRQVWAWPRSRDAGRPSPPAAAKSDQNAWRCWCVTANCRHELHLPKADSAFCGPNQRKRTTAGLAPDRCRSGRRQAGAATSGLFQRDQSTLITILPKCPLAA